MKPKAIEIAHDLDVPRDSSLRPDDLAIQLELTWQERPGVIGWLSNINHKSIGKRYIVTAFIHLLLAGLLAVVIRVQLAYPELQILDPDLYNQFFTMHGFVMMFLFAVPVVEGVMIYLVPLMLGTRLVAFPRLNAFSYYVYLAGGIFVWVAFFLNVGPDVGWFGYVPLSGPEYGHGKRPDIYAQLITFTEIAGLIVAVQMIVTILKLRAPGMSLNRMPTFVWASLVTSFMIVFSMPAVVVASTLLILDRLVGTHFYNPAEGGDVLLWQHLFWYFAHPEVYIIFLPCVGLASHIVETYSGRPIFGYSAIVLSLIANGLLSFGLWVHHMYATGLPRLGNSFFAASSMAIAIPTGIVIFCWLATIASGRLRMGIPMLWIVSFFVLFIIGGLTGVMLASVPIDLQLTDSYAVVGHIHYVLLGGAVAPLFGALFFWFPKLTGRLLDERLGLAQWALYLVGSFVSFGGMFLLGLSGMTRRVYTYSATMQWDTLNLITTTGATLIALSMVVLLFNIGLSLRARKIASANPWDAPGLEWAVASPPPVYNFALTPFVESRTPLWTNRGEMTAVGGLRVDQREVLVTTTTLAEPDMRDPLPASTIWPFIAAVVTSITLVVSIYSPEGFVWGCLATGVTLIGWGYPRKRHAPEPDRIPRESTS